VRGRGVARVAQLRERRKKGCQEEGESGSIATNISLILVLNNAGGVSVSSKKAANYVPRVKKPGEKCSLSSEN